MQRLYEIILLIWSLYLIGLSLFKITAQEVDGYLYIVLGFSLVILYLFTREKEGDKL